MAERVQGRRRGLREVLDLVVRRRGRLGRRGRGARAADGLSRDQEGVGCRPRPGRLPRPSGAAGDRVAAGAGARPAGAEATRRHAQPHGGAAEGAGARHGAPGALLRRRSITGPQRPCRSAQEPELYMKFHIHESPLIWFLFLKLNQVSRNEMEALFRIYEKHCIGNTFTIRGYIQIKGYAIHYLLFFLDAPFLYPFLFLFLHTLFFRRSNCKYLQSLIVMQNFLYTPMYHQVKVAPSASVAFILDVPMLFLYCPKGI